MRILLVRPAPAREIFGDESFQPLGIAYLAAVLQGDGHGVRILDLLVCPKDDEAFDDELRAFEPAMVGFSVVTTAASSFERLAKSVRRVLPGAFIVCGGPHATALPEECLRRGADAVVLGEGEATVSELARGIENLLSKGRALVAEAAITQQGLDFVRGVVFRTTPPNYGPRAHAAESRSPELRDYIADLDALPFPARRLLPDISRYRGQEALGSLLPVGSMITSRGCPFRCAFCFKAVFGNRFRARSPNSVLSEWDHLRREFRVREIAIVDDSFTTDPSRVEAICDGIISDGMAMPWTCPNGIRVDSASPELLRKMNRAGCYRVALGVESGNQKVLDEMGKGISLARIAQAVSDCRAIGIKTMAFFMLGNLGETEKTMKDTIEFAIRLNPDYAQFLIAIPQPGSPLFDRVRSEGRLLTEDWDLFGQYEGSSLFEHGELNPGLMSRMSREAYRRYYGRPGYLLKQLFNPETWRHLPRRMKAAARVFLKY